MVVEIDILFLENDIGKQGLSPLLTISRSSDFAAVVSGEVISGEDTVIPGHYKHTFENDESESYFVQVDSVTLTGDERFAWAKIPAYLGEYATSILAIQADLDNPDQYKADVSALALEANITGYVTTALTSYDPPTRTEATSDKDEVLAAIPSVAALALEANVQGHVTTVLNLYDPPTRAELTSDKNEIILSGEAKIDALNNIAVTDILSDSTPFAGSYIDVAISSRNESGEYDSELAAIQNDLDNPDQYKADVTNLDAAISTRSPIGEYDSDLALLSLEATSQSIKTKTDTLDWDDITFLKDRGGGRWLRDVGTLTLYKSDNATEVAVFNLYNISGELAGLNENVFDIRRLS
uniref:Tail protein n=1 Tax=viral metagenome TaxID=1070528 RepID=A0A6M3IQ26_9ZZZZ